MKISAFILASFIFSGVQNPGESKCVSVLCYHAFIENRNMYCISCDELSSHIKFLKKKGCRFISFNDFKNDNYRGRNNVLVTVDDGNRSVYTAYKNVFKPEGIKPLLAVYPSIIGKKKYALSWKQLKEMADDGCEIASHGYHHFKMNERLFKKDNKTFRNELELSKKIIEKKLSRKINVFVYPYGISCIKAHPLMKKTGYRYAFNVKPESLTGKIQKADKMNLPRYMMTKYNSKLYTNNIVKKILPYGKRQAPGIVSGNTVKKQIKHAAIERSEMPAQNYDEYGSVKSGCSLSENIPFEDNFLQKVLLRPVEKRSMPEVVSLAEDRNFFLTIGKTANHEIKSQFFLSASGKRTDFNRKGGKVLYVPGTARFECRELFKDTTDFYDGHLKKYRENFSRFEIFLKRIFHSVSKEQEKEKSH